MTGSRCTWAATLVLACVPAASVALAAPAPVDIPFTLEGSNIVLQVELTPGHLLPFVFDSGLSTGNIISADTAKALDLKPNANMDIRDANGARNQGKLVTLPSMAVGGIKLSNQLFAIIPIPENVTHRPGKGKPPIAGFLGAPLMKDAVLCLDYRHHVLHRWNAQDFNAARFSTVAMPLTHGLPTIHVRIDEREANLIVDSGNNGALTVYPDFAMKNNFEKRYPHLAPDSEFSGSGTSEALSTEADAVEIGTDVGFRHVPLTVIPQGMDPAWGIDGMVGFVILSRLDPCLDRDGKRFLFRTGGSLPSASASPAPLNDGPAPSAGLLAVTP